MARIDVETNKKAQKILKQEKVFTLERLVSILKCSSRTAQTKLKQWRTYTSYNQNGRYYTMPTIPRFDVNGLWRYENKYFSRHGNLKKTVIHLIHNSDSGLSGDQIGKLIGLSPRSFLHHFIGLPEIRREKKEGVYVYFSNDPGKYTQQMSNRMTALPHTVQPLSDADAIMILVALIKHHNITIKDIMALPEVKARGLSCFIIREFLEHHGLLKKTLDTRP
jgi:hypothetical protein